MGQVIDFYSCQYCKIYGKIRSIMTTLKKFRLPTVLAKRLSSLAKAAHRSEGFYVKEALKYYFEDYADARIAKDRFNNPTSKAISDKKLRGRLVS